MIAVGGEGTTDVSGDVQAYEIKRRTWSQLPGLPSARHGVAVTALKGSLYAIGGGAAAGHVRSTDKAELLDLG